VSSSASAEVEAEQSLRGVWCFNVALAACVTAVWYLLLRDRGVPSTGLHLPWLLLAVGFGAAEKWAVHVRIRGRHQTLGLAELPLVLGLVFCSPSELIAAQVVGGAVALVLEGRTEPVKLAFNLALFGLTASVAAAVFVPLAGTVGAPDARVWLALGTATLMADFLAYAAMIALYGFLGGLPPLRDAVWMLAVGAVETLGMTVVGLLPVAVLGFDRDSAWLLIAPALAAVVAFRSFTRDRVRADRLEQLYRTLGEADPSDVFEERAAALLDSAIVAFEATHAELLLEDEGRYQRFRAPKGDIEALEELTPADRLLMDEASARAVLVRSRRGGEVDPLLERGLVRAMATVMRGHAGTGLLIVGDRSGHDASFRDEDLVRFEAFAAQANAGLQVVRLRRLERAAYEEARRDELTQLVNRKRYAEIVDEALGKGEPVAVVSLDIDDFKVVNGRLGHDAGDVALRDLARRVQRSLPLGDVAVRLGGDEFACVLRGATTPGEAARRAADVLRDIAQPLLVEGHRFSLAASAGIVVAERPTTPNALLTSADLALGAAKERGGGQVATFEPALLEAAQARRRLEADLARGIEDGEIEAFYQPLVDLKSGSLIGFEALARWRHPERGLLPPGAFLGVAESTGLILPLGREMLNQACHQATRFDAMSAGTLLVSVNLSAAQLSDASLAAQVRHALTEASTDPARLWLEVTETVAMVDVEQNLARMRELRETGVSLALDDFGTGHSSLAYLQRFPFGIIKLARELVSDVDQGANELTIVDFVADLAARFGLRTVAEGIERVEQVEVLERFEIGQGFLWSEPVTASRAEALALQWDSGGTALSPAA
jgi:diguanylate cyclase (GGDEF)-like protein